MYIYIYIYVSMYMYVCVYIYIYIYIPSPRCLNHIRFLDFEGWHSQAHTGMPGIFREFPRKFESSNLSRDNLSREIGRTDRLTCTACANGLA